MNNGIDILQIILESGLVVKLVLLLLLFSSLYSWFLIFGKLSLLKDIRKSNKEFFESFRQIGTLKQLKDSSLTHIDSPMNLMLQEGLREHTRLTEVGGARDSLENIERALKIGAQQAESQFETNMVTLASIGSTAPFVGLFGTVWGIINSFTGLSSGGATLETVAPGIAEALVATAVGLAAAIPAVLFFNKFNQEIGGIKGEMESFGDDFLNLISRDHQRESRS